MSVVVQIPETLRDYCGCHDELFVSAHDVGHALKELQRIHPHVYQCVCDETGEVRRHIHLFVNNDLVAMQDRRGSQVRLNAGDILTIWTAVSGG